jgi:CheY-like chemotaxis protein
MWRVLCVDDKKELAEQIGEFLTGWTGSPYGSRFAAYIETSFTSALDRLKNERFDLVTLDLHGANDPEPGTERAGSDKQEGERVLDELRKIRFVPVIFYTAYADRLSDIVTPVVRVVKKGSNDLQAVRSAAEQIYMTGLPSLIRHIEEEERKYIWDTIDKEWRHRAFSIGTEELSYLLARRLAARFSRNSVKELLKHPVETARAIERYIFPPVNEKIRTGSVCRDKTSGECWIVATPACDFATDRVEMVLLIGAKPLDGDKRFRDWRDSNRWNGTGVENDKDSKRAYDKLSQLMRNAGGERYRFLPGTFFLPDLVVDIQLLKQVALDSMKDFETICQLDSPYREQFVLDVSSYYGRLGTPNLETSEIFARLLEAAAKTHPR